MDNEFLLEMAIEVRRIAIQDQPLNYVEVVAEYQVEDWCFWSEIMIRFYQYSLRRFVFIGNYTHFE